MIIVEFHSRWLSLPSTLQQTIELDRHLFVVNIDGGSLAFEVIVNHGIGRSHRFRHTPIFDRPDGRRGQHGGKDKMVGRTDHNQSQLGIVGHLHEGMGRPSTPQNHYRLSLLGHGRFELDIALFVGNASQMNGNIFHGIHGAGQNDVEWELATVGQSIWFDRRLDVLLDTKFGTHDFHGRINDIGFDPFEKRISRCNQNIPLSLLFFQYQLFLMS
mmetsp:Transcript_130502/g.365113  ORF Transcript_130502/g.365113 Transcript_130502/m.365113 type:complete len:215 (+) Transcript_130502:1269-1913(+)